MSEYTPTMQQVEDSFAYDPEYEYHHPDDAGYHHRNRAAFRRWLATHDAEKDQRIRELESRLRADIDLMGVAGIGFADAEKALAAHDATVAAEALKAVGSLSEEEAMDLWWEACSDEWAVPDYLPAKYLKHVVWAIQKYRKKVQ
jgi:hypothetical protein